jgi:hypothetical protein
MVYFRAEFMSYKTRPLRPLESPSYDRFRSRVLCRPKYWSEPTIRTPYNSLTDLGIPTYNFTILMRVHEIYIDHCPQ